MVSATDANLNPQQERLYRVLKALRGSLLLSTVAIGIGLLLVAAVFDSGTSLTQIDGVIAGMLGVFGISAVLTGGVGYALIRVFHRR